MYKYMHIFIYVRIYRHAKRLAIEAEAAAAAARDADAQKVRAAEAAKQAALASREQPYAKLLAQTPKSQNKTIVEVFLSRCIWLHVNAEMCNATLRETECVEKLMWNMDGEQSEWFLRLVGAVTHKHL